jgi:hypothetical protein
MKSEWPDRFVNMLLQEKLGGDRPGGCKEKILLRARAAQMRRRIVRIASGLAVAAAVALGVFVWRFAPEKISGGRPDSEKVAAAYPPARIKGQCSVEGELDRGARIVADKGEATLSLGGYAEVDFAPESVCLIEGAKNNEQVYLERGGVHCRVIPAAAGMNRSFSVRTECGTAQALGTEFSVLLDETEDANMKKMLVKVVAGVVLVTGIYGESKSLLAGEQDAVKKTVAVTEAKKEPEKSREQLVREAYQLQIRMLRLRLEDIEEDIMENEELVKKSDNASTVYIAYREALEADPEYIELNKQIEEINNDRQKQMDAMRKATPEERKELMAAMHGEGMREAGKKQAELNNALRKLPLEKPELKKLKDAAEEAVLAVNALYEKLLDADKQYRQLEKDMESLQEESILGGRAFGKRGNRMNNMPPIQFGNGGNHRKMIFMDGNGAQGGVVIQEGKDGAEAKVDVQTF